MSEWAALRAEFPALARHTYLNAAAASPTPRPVRAAIERLHRELEEDGDGHWDAWLARREEVRAAVARLVNASPEEIAFVPNTSTGINAIAFPIDVRRSRIDAFATAGHKWLCAGYGAGFVYIGQSLLQRQPRTMGWLSVKAPFSFDNRRDDLLDSAQRIELGCPPFAQIFALGAAVDFLAGVGVDRIATRVLSLNTKHSAGSRTRPT